MTTVKLTFTQESGLNTVSKSTWASGRGSKEHACIEVPETRTAFWGLGNCENRTVRRYVVMERPSQRGRLVDRPWGPVVLCPHLGRGAKAGLHLGIGSEYDVGIDWSVKRVSKQAQGCRASDQQGALPSDLTSGDRETGEAHGHDQPMTVLLQ